MDAEAPRAPSRKEQIVNAYLDGEGGYGTLAKRFGISKKTVEQYVREAGASPGFQVQIAPTRVRLCGPDLKEEIPWASKHARVRAFERLGGLVPTREEWGACVLDIIEGRSLLVRRYRAKNGQGLQEVHGVRLAGVETFVAYAPDAATIITVLPNGREGKS